MSRQRRTFTPEFKCEAAGLVLDQGYSLTEAARSLDLVESALRRWVNQLQSERDGATPTSNAAPRAAEDPRAGSSDQPAGTGEIDFKELPPRRSAAHWTSNTVLYTYPTGQWSLAFWRLSPRQKT